MSNKHRKLQLYLQWKPAKFCKKCGKPNDVDAAFCVRPGNPFVTETTEETNGGKQMFCERCGKEIKDGGSCLPYANLLGQQQSQRKT